MTTMYDDSNIRSIPDLRTFLDAAEVLALQASCPRRERAQWIYDRLVRFKYQTHPKKDKGIVLQYILLITGLRHVSSVIRMKQHPFLVTLP